MANWNGVPARSTRIGGSVLMLALLVIGIDGPVYGEPAEEAVAMRGLPEPEGLLALSPEKRIWIDKNKRRLVLDGEICLQKGALELLICPWNGKLHESVIRVHSKPSTIHAGLLALGCEPGAPVSFQDEYIPAHGDVVDIVVRWLDESGKWKEAHGQDLVRHRDTPANRDDPTQTKMIERAEKTTSDQTLYLDEVESFWIPVHPAFADRMKSEKGRVTRPSAAGKQVEQLMILTDPRALDPNRPEPKEYYRTQFSPAKRDNPEHQKLIEQARNNQGDEIRGNIGSAEQTNIRVLARWEPVFPNRKEIIESDANNVLRPSVAGKQIEELIIRGKPLDHDWVFAGSHIVTNPETGEEFYVADRSGEIVCVSNFPTAMIDLPIESSSDNAYLGFEAAEENIPPKGTPVRLFLMPTKAKRAQPNESPP